MAAGLQITEYRCSVPAKYIPEFLGYFYPPEQHRQLPFSQRIEAGALFIDVSSFTRLTEQATAKGHYGVEIITGVLNSYYELVNRCIRANGGEIAKFAGDAILALFFGDEASSMAAIKACGDSLARGLCKLNKGIHKRYGFVLSFHGMAYWGSNSLIVFGNPEYHLDYIIYGSGLRRLFKDGVPDQLNKIVWLNKGKQTSAQDINIEVLRRRKNTLNPNSYLPLPLRDAALNKRFSAELRNVALLFLRLDARHLKGQYLRNLDKAFRHIQACVYRFEGMVSKTDYNEKGLVVICTFGFPVAHLNDVQRAVFAARAIMDYAHKGIFRIGITYSNIYTGLLGSKARHEYGIIGSGVNAAARLMMEAEADEILISSQILPHVEVRFATQYLKQALVKGFPQPIEIHKITAELPVSHHSLSKLFAAQKIVAWQQEMDKIVASCLAKEAAHIFIAGEPGTGKTFVLWNLLTRLHRSGKAIAMLPLEEFNQATPYYLIHFLLSEYFGIPDAMSHPDKLVELLGLRAGELNTEMLQQYFKASTTNHKTDFDRSIIQDIIFDQLNLLLEQLSNKINILVVDNLHWCDAMSLKLLQKFAAHKQRTCDLIITSRYGAHRELFAEPEVLLELHNLPEEKAHELISHHLPLIAEDAAAYILKLSAGNPLFITELCRQIRLHQQKHRLITLADILSLERRGALPHTIENLFVQRLTYFDPDMQYLLKLAAIVGKAFTLDELSILDSERLQDTVIDLLNSLDSDSVISRANITPDIVYIFTNNLMREAIYNTILLSEKKDLHSQIARHYEQRYEEGKNDDIEIIANHYILAENPAKANKFSILAAARNYALANFEEASYYYQMALDYSDDEEQKNELYLCLADSQFYHTELDKAAAVLSNMPIPPAHTENYARYIYLNAKAHYLKNEYQSLIEHVNKAAEKIPYGHHYYLTMIFLADSLRAINDISALQKLLASLGGEINRQLRAYDIPGLCYHDSDFKLLISAIKHQQLPDSIHDTLYYICKLEGINGQLQLNRGNLHSSATHFRNVLELARFLDDNISIRIAYNSLANLLAKQGKLSSAMRYYQKAKTLCEKSGDRYGYSKVIMDIGVMYRQQGNTSAALEVYTRSEAMASLIGNKAQQENAIYNIGIIHYQEDRLDEAEASFMKALQLATEISDNFGISYANDALGDLATAKNDLDKAEGYYRRNLEFQIEIGDKEGIAHSLGNLGNIANAREDYATALTYYEKNLAICQEVEDLDGEGKAWFNSAMASLSLQQYKESLDKLYHSQECFHRAKINLYDSLITEKIEECTALLET